MKLAASIIDADAADVAADNIVLAYELGDTLEAYAGDDPELAAHALSIMQIVILFNLQPATEKDAVREFVKGFRRVRKIMRGLGKDAKLSEVITEMHLDDRKDRKR